MDGYKALDEVKSRLIQKWTKSDMQDEYDAGEEEVFCNPFSKVAQIMYARHSVCPFV